MMATTTEAPADVFRVNDHVELVEPVAHCKVPLGSRGVVVVDGLPWQMVTVVFGCEPERATRAYMLRPRHLRKLSDTASQRAATVVASPATGFWSDGAAAGSVAGSSGGNNPATGRPRPPEIAAQTVADMPHGVVVVSRPRTTPPGTGAAAGSR